jgi:MOSC domain-containing protein
MSLQVTDIWRYPVKSCRGERLDAAVVEPWGLAGDRRWMIVDSAGDVVTAREYPPLVLVTPRIDGDSIWLTSPGLPELTVPVPSGEGLAPVSVHGNELAAAPVGDEASEWLGKIIGEPVRLVYLDDPTRRRPNPDYSQPGDRVSFADGYPLMMTTGESLAALNDLILEGRHAAEGPLPMRRFRPSVVITGAPAWAEDGWRRLRIGEVTFRVANGCDRCVFTTIDPDTAVKGREPLITLSRHRQWDGKVWFGIQLIPDTPRPGESIAVGAPVTILE